MGVAVFVASTLGRSDGPVSSASEYTDTHAGLCAALDVYDPAAPEAAHAVFMERAHAGLHQLAARTADESRRQAARLLEAKAAVEASLPTGNEAAADDLHRLERATAAAIETLTGEAAVACPATEG